MARLLFQICTDPTDASRVALGLLVAKTARAQGHDVDVFLAGDGVYLLDAQRRATTEGLGLGTAAEHWEELVAGGARLYASARSAKARGFDAADGVELVQPTTLVELITGADRVVTY